MIYKYSHERLYIVNYSEQAKTFLSSMKGNWPKVAVDAGVQHQFICRFMDGRIKDPRVSKIEKILSYAESQGWTYQPSTDS